MPAFKNFRKKLRRRRIETALLAGYAFAVTCALFLSLLNKPFSAHPKLPITHVSSDSYDFGSDILTPAFNDSAADNPFDLAYTEVNNIKLLSANEVITSKFEVLQGAKNVVMPIGAKPKYENDYGEISGIYQKERRVLVVEKGDTFIGLLTNLGMNTKSATEAYNVLKKVFDARNLRVGQHIELTATFDVRLHQLEMLDKLTITPERGVKYTLSVNEYDKYVAHVEREKFEADVKVVSGEVNGAVLNSLINAGVTRRIANEVINRMSYMVNFRTDIHKGDTFNIKYDVSKAANGDVVKIGNLLSASFKTGKRTFKIYRFKDNNYYNEKGETKKTGLDIKPLAMRGARISSLFGYRRHPIHKTMKFHNGVDYAAPKGTAIFASGNGVVEMAQYVSGYGNYIKIRHNGEYETAYGHMNGYAKGIRKGVRVRKGQVIGYVGSTGQSTGPHLHFEILRKGQRINPLKSNVATGNDLGGAQLTEFKHRMNQIDAMKEKIFRKEEAAPVLASVLEAEKVAAEKVESEKTPSIAEKDEVAADAGENFDSSPKDAVKPIVESGAKNEAKTGMTPLEEVLQKMEQAKAESVSEVNATDTPAMPSVQPEGTKQEQPEVSSENAIPSSYKGKVYRAPVVSAAAARQRYFSTHSTLASGKKIIKVPVRKPRYAKR